MTKYLRTRFIRQITISAENYQIKFHHPASGEVSFSSFPHDKKRKKSFPHDKKTHKNPHDKKRTKIFMIKNSQKSYDKKLKEITIKILRSQR